MGLTLAKALRLPSAPCVAFVGAGGKTTAMFQLARQLNPPVIVTATTHLGAWQLRLADKHVIPRSRAVPIDVNFEGTTLVTGPLMDDQRTERVDEDVLYWLRAEAQKRGIPLLIEADGARQKSLKAPASHEPPIPGFADMVVVMAGLSALNKPLTDEFVHRPEIYSGLSGLKLGERISGEVVVRVLSHPDGGLKNIPADAQRVVLLNQADTVDLQATAQKMSEQLLASFQAVIIASLRDDRIFATQERVAGIVLAAGESKRFGKPKQLLDWRGEPFVRAVAKTGVQAGLSPVIVVTGSNAPQVEAAIRDLPIKIIRNENWQSGQSSSIREGILALPHPTSPTLAPGRLAPAGSRPEQGASVGHPLQIQKDLGRAGEGPGAAIFLLADQPQVTAGIIHALVSHHAQELHPIVAPLVLMEQRANPVLFDRDTFSDLLALEGEVGGRGIFSKHKVEYLPWHDDSLLFDVDEPEDYQRLKELE
jgi:molybdenum cofactor cytidylyltransferase